MFSGNHLRLLEESLNQLTQAQTQLRNYFELSSDLLCVLQPDGAFCLLSPAWEQVMGWDVESFKLQNWLEWVHPDDVKISQTQLQLLLDQKDSRPDSQPSCTFENRVRHADRTYHFLSWQVFLGKHGLLYAVVQQVDKADSRVANLNQTEEELRQINLALANAMPGISRISSEGYYTQVNAYYAQMVGYEPDEMLQMLWEATIHPEDVNIAVAAHQKMLREGKGEFEARGVRKNGSVFYKQVLIVKAEPSSYSTDYFCFSRDISDRKQAEAALRKREQEFRALVEHAPDVIMRLDRHFRFLYINREAERITGTPASEFIGHTAEEMGFPEALVSLWHGAMQQVFETGQEQRLKYDIPTKGKLARKYSRIVPEFAMDGAVESVLAVVRDITELEQAEAILRRQAEQEHLIRTITHRIHQSLDLEDILNTTAAEVRQFLQTERVIVYRFHPDWSGSVVVESVNPNCIAILGQTIQDHCFEHHWHYAYKGGRISTVEDIHTSPLHPCYRELLANLNVRANLVVPILHGEMLWGLLIAHHCSEPKRWQPSQVNLLKQLTSHLAIAIQQSELYQQVRQLNTNLETQVQERTAQLQQAFGFEAMLKRITDKVRDSLDEAQILQTAVQELALGLEVSSCDAGIYDLTQKTSTITYEYVRSKVSAVQGIVVPMENYSNMYTQLLQGQFLHFCWQDSPPRVGDTVRRIRNKYVALACPLVDDQSVLGDLWLYKLGAAHFDEPEIRLVQQVANQCAIAIRQARLYQAAQVQVMELERLNRLKDDFLNTISHELRTPISNIKMATQMLEISLGKLGILDEGFSSVTRYFQMLKEESQREIRLINDLLDLSRIDAEVEPLVLTTINPQVWITHVAEPFLQRAYQQQQQLTLNLSANLPSLTTDLSNLERIFTELLSNACKYTPPRGTITVSAEVVKGEEIDRGKKAVHEETNSSLTSSSINTSTEPQSYLNLSVTNSGVEIPSSEYDRIFGKFYRIPNNDPWKYEGTGLGLALVKKLVERLGGTIHVESSAGQITFTLHLPIN